MTTSLFSTMNAYAHGFRSERNETVTTDADYTVGQLADGLEKTLLVTNTSAPRTVGLPDALQMPIGYKVLVKDASGGAATHAIAISATVNGQIDGGNSVSLNDNYGSRAFVCTGTGWAMIESSAGSGGGGGGAPSIVTASILYTTPGVNTSPGAEMNMFHSPIQTMSADGTSSGDANDSTGATDHAFGVLMPTCTLKNLRVCTTAQNGGETVTVYKNGVATTLKTTSVDGANHATDSTHTVAFASGDRLQITFKCDDGGSGTPVTEAVLVSVELS